MYATSNVFSSRLRFVAFCVHLLVLLSGVHPGANKKTVDQTKSRERAWNQLTESLALDEIALKAIGNAGESPLLVTQRIARRIAFSARSHASVITLVT